MAASAAPVVMATRGVPVPADVGQTASEEIACGAEGAEPLVEALPSY